MKRLHLFFLSGISVFHTVIAQNDTIWYSEGWNETSRENAAYYRPPIRPKGDGFMLEDYYISGVKQMEAFSKEKDRDIFDGVVTWFSEKGEITQQAHYKEGDLHGEFISYIDRKNVVKAVYRNDKIESGTTLGHNKVYNFYWLKEYKDGQSVREAIYEEKPYKGLRAKIEHGQGEQRLSQTRYYDSNGDVTARFTAHTDEPGNTSFYNGTRLEYYYSPMKKKGELVYENGVFKKYEVFYPSGKVRERNLAERDSIYTTYYDENGNTLGKLTSFYNRSEHDIQAIYNYPVEGTKINFKRTFWPDEPQYITNATTYKNGKKEAYKTFYNNGKLKEYRGYDEGKMTRQETYSENGEEMDALTYKDGKPYNGVQVLYNGKTVFKDGVPIEKIKTYADGTLFGKETTDRTVYYDRNGEKMGELEYRLDEFGIKKHHNGDHYRLSYDAEQISSITTFKEGRQVKYVEFAKNGPGNKPLKKREHYYNEEGRMLRDKTFYSNGQLQSDLIFNESGYKVKEKATYYDMDGNLLSIMEFRPEKNGTEYTFLFGADHVESVKVYDKGRLTHEKKYGEDRRAMDRKGRYPVYLEKEIDYNGKASFYDENGNLTGEATYKDGKPLEGKVIKKEITGITEKSSYKAGVLTSKEYWKSDRLLREISYTENRIQATGYDDSGNKSVFYNITDLENRNGEVIYYSADGKQKEKGTIVGGEPVSGVFYLESFYVDYTRYSRNDGKIKTIKLEITGEKYTISGFDEETEEIFSITERKTQNNLYFFNKLILPDYFYRNFLEKILG